MGGICRRTAPPAVDDASCRANCIAVHENRTSLCVAICGGTEGCVDLCQRDDDRIEEVDSDDPGGYWQGAVPSGLPGPSVVTPAQQQPAAMVAARMQAAALEQEAPSD